ncbi:MAG: hypothetical protein HYV63_28440 [Candidatus Schekmanbacteria bacterium]|nr:hypothetical protein [Candidatus Schekmanbacteria bacterium]
MIKKQSNPATAPRRSSRFRLARRLAAAATRASSLLATLALASAVTAAPTTRLTASLAPSPSSPPASQQSLADRFDVTRPTPLQDAQARKIEMRSADADGNALANDLVVPAGRTAFVKLEVGDDVIPESIQVDAAFVPRDGCAVAPASSFAQGSGLDTSPIGGDVWEIRFPDEQAETANIIIPFPSFAAGNEILVKVQWDAPTRFRGVQHYEINRDLVVSNRTTFPRPAVTLSGAPEGRIHDWMNGTSPTRIAITGDVKAAVPLTSFDLIGTAATAPVTQFDCQLHAAPNTDPADPNNTYWDYRFQTSFAQDQESAYFVMDPDFFVSRLMRLRAGDLLTGGNFDKLPFVATTDGWGGSPSEGIPMAAGMRSTPRFVDKLQNAVNDAYLDPDFLFDILPDVCGSDGDRRTVDYHDDPSHQRCSGDPKSALNHDDGRDIWRIDMFPWTHRSTLDLVTMSGSVLQARVRVDSFAPATGNPVVKAWYNMNNDGKDPYVCDVRLGGTTVDATFTSTVGIRNGAFVVTNPQLTFNSAINVGHECDDWMEDVMDWFTDVVNDKIEDELEDVLRDVIEHELVTYLNDDLFPMLSDYLRYSATFDGYSLAIGGALRPAESGARSGGIYAYLDGTLEMTGAGPGAPYDAHWLKRPADLAAIASSMDAYNASNYDVFLSLQRNYLDKALFESFASGYLTRLVQYGIPGARVAQSPVLELTGNPFVIDAGSVIVPVGGYEILVAVKASVLSLGFHEVPEYGAGMHALSIEIDPASEVYWELYGADADLYKADIAARWSSANPPVSDSLAESFHAAAEDAKLAAIDALEQVIEGATLVDFGDSFKVNASAGRNGQNLMIFGTINGLVLPQ